MDIVRIMCLKTSKNPIAFLYVFLSQNIFPSPGEFLP